MRAAWVILLFFALHVAGVSGTVATTTAIIADVVHNIVGDRLSILSLIPANTDPHAFEPTPQDLQALLKADVIFANGAGLEKQLQPLFSLPEVKPKVVELSADLPLRFLGDNPDPHVWLDPLYVVTWVEKITAVLSALIPEERAFFEANEEKYRMELYALDQWIRTEVEKIPKERRLLVTDHFALGYFAARYGFVEVGAILPSEASLAEPSAREISALIRRIQELRIPAIFVNLTFDQALAARVAAEAGVRIVPLYLGTLSEPGGPAADYLSLMRENVRRIVGALGS
ncbi:MAG: metal ABC transporter substrate-binding protein [Candidatus Bipolaricaulota bacterium]|nr:metal ABC transporter substrate-binding protein [Candidatus Bipolaricaulota bacterium]MDW8126846.1 metal ABC transporter substrate-binding protein [Candidatus Bipolaricaulota bacterium]